MAKKNKAFLIGEVAEILQTDPLMFEIKIRKNEDRYVYPIVKVVYEEIYERKQQVKDKKFKMINKNIKQGAIVIVEGFVTTEMREDVYDCPNSNCNAKITDKYIFTYVTARNIQFFARKSEGQEISLNNVILLGAVCRDIEFKYIEGSKSSLGNTKYQMGVNGRGRSDYPWVSSFARQAEEDANRLQKSSQILIDGLINTRKSTKEAECDYCNSKLKILEYLAEVNANTVEYLDKCIFNDN
ncbi:MAG: single-stranded DNA-binding protein [Candidatus Woesearchaeota archaeon]